MSTLLKRVKKLPKNFVWGAATAAYQVEGNTNLDGKGKIMWDDYLKSQGNFSPNPACDFYHRYPKDLKLAHNLGLNAVRISIAWTRILPNGYVTNKQNEAGVKYYHRLFHECLKNNLVPYVTLHHFDSPKTLFDQGDWLNREMINEFVKYADFCFQEFAEVDNWFTINELISLAMCQYIQGTFPPNKLFDVSDAIQAQHNELVAHAKVVNLFKAKGYKGRIGLIHVIQPVYPATNSEADRHAADLRDAFMNRFLLDGTLLGFYSDRTQHLIKEILVANNAELKILPEDLEILKQASKQNDMLGINYYQNQTVASYEGPSETYHNGNGKKGSSIFAFHGVGKDVRNPAIPTTDWDWNIYPEGLYDVLKRIEHDYPDYPVIYITENGMGAKEAWDSSKQYLDDDYRIDFIDQHLAAILKARNEGVNVQGYFLWSLQDQFSWSNGYNKRYGLIYVDFASQDRHLKRSALWFKALSKTMQ